LLVAVKKLLVAVKKKPLRIRARDAEASRIIVFLLARR
jgi:hypothetical protein